MIAFLLLLILPDLIPVLQELVQTQQANPFDLEESRYRDKLQVPNLKKGILKRVS